jgi:hypothetical protein
MTNDLSNLPEKLSEIIEEIFLVLSSKEKDVIVQRFSLDNKPKRTLESIGKKFSVTRERIRQIEKIALNKLKRTIKTTRLNSINQLAYELVKEQGGVLIEDDLVEMIMESIGSDEKIDSHIIRLGLNIHQELEKIEKNNLYHTFWRSIDVPVDLITSIIQTGYKHLKKKGEVIADEKLIAHIRGQLGGEVSEYSDNLIVSCLSVDNRLKRTEDGFGLMNWRHINPKSIRDKAYIVLKEAKKPLHFNEIAEKIKDAEFDNKDVTIQAVHNELIRYEQFVLVGRGLYALKEQGYKKGTVTEIIADLLRGKESMTKQEIIEGVLKQRHVKKGTISLNLQKNSQFVRIGRAVYTLDENA